MRLWFVAYEDTYGEEYCVVVASPSKALAENSIQGAHRIINIIEWEGESANPSGDPSGPLGPSRDLFCGYVRGEE